MHFAQPGELWWLTAVAVLAVFVVRYQRQRRASMAAFAATPMLARMSAEFSPRRAMLKTLLVMAALTLVVIGLAGPEWGSKLETTTRRGIDVVIAVDCSSSMSAKDVKPSRLIVARQELGNLVKQLQGNRLGLVGFAGTAFTFCPLTLDVSATRLFIEQLDTNVMPIPGTSIGEAIHTASQTFPAGDTNNKVILLLTDGEDHHSDPVGAARQAAREGIAIDTVGIGSPNGEPIPETDESGRTEYVRDSNGNIVMSRLDETTLRQIAGLTGGQYVHVDGTQVDPLAPILAAIQAAPRSTLEETRRRRYVERYQPFILVAILLLILERWVSTRKPEALRPRRLPGKESPLRPETEPPDEGRLPARRWGRGARA